MVYVSSVGPVDPESGQVASGDIAAAEAGPADIEVLRELLRKHGTPVLAAVVVALVAAVVAVFALPAQAQTARKPNILVIFGDDVGMWNISAYHRGMMGGSTPNIDRIAAEGALFTDYYAQQSCTAGRAAFITGQHPFRTGLLTIGMPGADQGLQPLDPTLAENSLDGDYRPGREFGVTVSYAFGS